MTDSSASQLAHGESQWLMSIGVLVGGGMTLLSVVGLLGRLTTASVAGCLVVAAMAGTAYARWSRASIVPRLIWITLPFLVLPALAAIALPPYSWDEVAYGAALPRDFAREGRLFYNADYGAYAAFPANCEALVAAALVIARGVWLTQLLNVALAGGMAIVSVLLARALGVSKRPSLLAGLFVLCAPALIEVAPLTKNDTANAFFQALGVWALVVYIERRGYPAAVASGAFLGVSLGIKYSSLQFVLAVAPFAIVPLFRAASGRAAGFGRVLAWAGTLALVASPWYLRNLLVFGNPMFPFLNETLHARNAFSPEHSALLRESFDGLRNYSWRTGTLAVFTARLLVSRNRDSQVK